MGNATFYNLKLYKFGLALDKLRCFDNFYYDAQNYYFLHTRI